MNTSQSPARRAATVVARSVYTVLTFAALSLNSGCATGSSATAHSPMPPGIGVTGHGEAEGAPNIARITIGVETRGAAAAEASEQATQQMNAVTQAIQQHGVAAADMRTQNFSINFEQIPEPYPPMPPESGRPSPGTKPAEAGGADRAAEGPRGFYRVSNSLLVTVRDLSRLGAVLAATTGAGANNIWGIQFEIDDPTPLEAEAREKAVAQATARAEQLARLLGVKLGKVISVGQLGGGPVSSGGGFEYSMKDARANVPVQQGQLTVSQDVQILFSIE